MSEQSIGLLEVKGLIAAVEATDAMVKSATVSYVGCKTTGETVLVVISGDYGSVCACLEIGMRQAQSFSENVTKHVVAIPHADTKKVLEDLLSSNAPLS